MKRLLFRVKANKFLLLFGLFITTHLIQAQSIQLLDLNSLEPISEATFRYNNTSGLSDENGTITFTYVPGEQMVLSHVSYGKWALSDEQIKHAIESGKTYKDALVINLYPATIIALHPKTDEIQSMELDYQDKMAHDGGAVLNSTPLINGIRKSGSYGFDPVMRGFKYDQLNVVVNGAQTALAACPNRMDPPTSQMAPNTMDRIEVLKGPHGLRYGNSFGGTINFVSGGPRFSETTDVYGRLSGGFENNGSIYRSEGVVGVSGQKYDWGLFGSWSQGSDYTDGSGNIVPAKFKRGSFGSNLGLKLADNQVLNLSATRNIARDVDFPALQMDLRKDDTWMLNANHSIELNHEKLKSWNTTLYGTFVKHLMDNFTKPLDPRMMDASTDAKTRAYGGRTEGHWKSGKSQLYVGSDLRIEEAEGTRLRTFLMGPMSGTTLADNVWQDSRISKSAVFAEYQLKSNSLVYVFSGRLELNQAVALNADQAFVAANGSTKNTQLNPSVSVGGIKNFEKNISLGFWLGRAQRSGSITERFINYFPVGLDPYEMLGTPNLKPEVNNQADLTFEFKTTQTRVNLDVFVAYLQNAISSVIDPTLTPRIPTSPGVRRYVNLNKALLSGFELNWHQNIVAGIQHQLSIAYTYGQDLERKEALPEIAPMDMRYRLYGRFLKNKLQPEISLRYVLAQNRVSAEYGETASPAFTLVDFSVNYKAANHLSLSAGVQNIFDVTYYEHLSRSVVGDLPHPIYAPGRNIFISMNIDFM